jgi:rare lipoprotein A
VTNLKNGKSVTLKVTDRLAANNKRLVDLTQRAARDLGFYNAGLTQVSVEVIGKKKSEKKVEQDLEEIGKDSTHTISSDSIR